MLNSLDKICPAREWDGWTPSLERALTGEPKRFSNGMSWEMDESGSHRIVESDGVGGDWAGYSSIAVSPSGHHICTTAYYEGTLPCETILEIGIVGVLPGSLGPDSVSAEEAPTIEVVVSAGPGAVPTTIRARTLDDAVSLTFQAVKVLCQQGAGAGYQVTQCESQNQHDKLMSEVNQRVNDWLASGARDQHGPQLLPGEADV